MTRLTFGKKVVRETSAIFAGRPICVEVGPHLVTFRLKGKRTKFTTTVVTLLETAMRVEAYRIIKQKKLDREQKRKARKAGL
jgi:hypothetical protein